MNTNCNNWPGYYECNEDDCKPGYVNWRANVGKTKGVDWTLVNDQRPIVTTYDDWTLINDP